MINNEADNLLFDSILTQALKQKNQIYLNSLPSEGELSRELDYSAEFKKKIQELITRYKRKSILKNTLVFMKKFVAILLIVAGLGFAVLMLNQPVRAALQNILTQWFDEYTRFDFQSNTSVLEPSEYEFRYIPEGFEITNHSLSDGFARYKYIDLSGNDIFIHYFPSTDEYSVSIDNEHSDYFIIKINESDGHLFKSNDEGSRSHLLWEQDGYAFSITSTLEAKEIIRIAENIKLIKK